MAEKGQKGMIIIGLDLSTSSTGYCVFEVKGRKKTLLKHGIVKPKVKGISKHKYPIKTYLNMVDVASKLKDIIAEWEPEKVYIEEVNRGINRIGQKGLDGLHWMVIHYCIMIDPDFLKKIHYVDSNGKTGWRTILGISIKDYKHLKGTSLRWKVAAQDFVNKKYKKEFDVLTHPSDADMIDSIAMVTSQLN